MNTCTKLSIAGALVILVCAQGAAPAQPTFGGGLPLAQKAPADWLPKWEQNIMGDARNRYCDKEMGEEIGWLVSPFLEGFYNGYIATKDTKWIDMFVDWSDSWIKRGIKEPDGYTGWPKEDGASTQVVPGLYTDNELGDAMALKPAVRFAIIVSKSPALKAKYAAKFKSYLDLSEEMYRKWDSRGCWRDTKEGGVWVVPTFGIDKATGKWTAGYAKKGVDGFSLPDNKQNLLAQWLLAMFDATHKPDYLDRAEKWFKVMNSRMKLRDNNRYFVWDYWDPAGPWDYKADGSTKHWVGVHPNGGYYDIDLHAIVDAYQHNIVFTKADIDRLISTNRDFMWNHQVQNASFQRIDGEKPDPNYTSPGVLWTALLPYDAQLREIFEANHKPASWGGLAVTPWYVAFRAVQAR